MREAWIYAVPGEKYALVRGHVGGWFRSRNIPAYRVNMNGGWWLRSERVSDVVALLEHDAYRVNLRPHSAPPYVPPTAYVDDLAS